MWAEVDFVRGKGLNIHTHTSRKTSPFLFPFPFFFFFSFFSWVVNNQTGLRQWWHLKFLFSGLSQSSLVRFDCSFVALFVCMTRYLFLVCMYGSVLARISSQLPATFSGDKKCDASHFCEECDALAHANVFFDL